MVEQFEAKRNPIKAVEEIDLLANATSCDVGPLPKVKRCPGAFAAGSAVRTVEFLNCALNGNSSTYNIWGKLNLQIRHSNLRK